ncbi:MAG: hypothetical protein GY849_00185 [Deltaproteobacteria bacterium]|nr:hypothetical protein [Deltaproteobacteria bacterium]
MKPNKFIAILLFVFLLEALAGAAWAGSRINIIVKTVLASQGASFIDPGLSSLTQDLQSVFRYSSYRLLSQDRMSLKLNQTGTTTLPGKRMLKITPLRISGNRVALRLAIHKKGRQIFETAIQLLNRGRITVGGPKYKGGYLLFNVFSSF